MQHIYIAGPDVFELNSINIGQKLVSLCEEYGYSGLYPLDNVVDFTQSKHKIAQDIFDANVAMIEKADIVIANLNAFRGKEPDSGTVWECGYALAKGKKVYLYMQDTSSYVDRFHDDEKTQQELFVVDNEEKIIEDFAHPLNLMLSCSATEIVQGTFEDVLKKIRVS